MAAGFIQIPIKDGSGTTQQMTVYQDASGNIYPAPTGTDALGHILGLAATPIDSNLYVGGSAIALGSAVSASSLPVVIASDQAAIATVSPIPVINTSSSYAHSASTTAYAFGEIWSNNTTGNVTFPTITVAKANNQACTLVGGILNKSGTTTTNALFRIHLFSAAPTSALVDRGTFQAGVTMTNWIGSFDCTINQAGTDVSIGTLIPTYGSVICTIPVSGAETLYWIPEVRGAYTPVSAETLTLTLWTQ